MLKQMLSRVAKMSSEYRSYPFWAWNAGLEEDEIRRQVKIFHDMGLGGFFMHSRVGLRTPYLGEKFFSCVRAAIDEAKKYNMLAWLYDEDRWPSGAAGGLVTKNPAFRMRYLEFREVIDGVPLPVLKDQEKILGFYSVTYGKGKAVIRDYKSVKMDSGAIFTDHPELRFVDGQVYEKAKDLPAVDESEGTKHVFAAVARVQVESPWYNGQTYLDTMNPKAVQKFIDVTHKKYAKEVGSEFGKTVPGIFTDEPAYLMTQNTTAPWTDAIPKEFKKKYGYDVLKRLPEIFFSMEQEPVSKPRIDYYDLATDLFVNAMSKLTGEYCAEHNLLYTGHLMSEDKLYGTMQYVGSTMRYYQYMGAPGIDMLTEHWNIYNTVKQCTSVAHQFGKKRRLTETYGCTGWDFPFFGHKALSDFQFVLGLNIMTPHLAWYSMEGEAKRDYPASISFQSPWYQYYPYVQNYFARIGAALSEGEETRDLLCIHPVENYWGLISVKMLHAKNIKTDPEHPGHPYADAFIGTTNELLMSQIDFDFGEEEIMSHVGSVTADGKLKVKLASYKAVLIPEMRTIRSSTCKLLKKFADKGGKVFFLGQNAPDHMDGVPSKGPAEIYKSFRRVTPDNMVAKISPVVRRVTLTTADGSPVRSVFYQLRTGKDFQTMFLCNVGEEPDLKMQTRCLIRDRKLEHPEICLSLNGQPRGTKVYELDLNTGKYILKNAVSGKAGLTVKTSFPQLGTRMFIYTKETIAGAETEAPALKEKAVMELPSAGWKYELDEQNVFVLDKAAWSVNKGKTWEPETYILSADTLLRDKLGIPHRGGEMCQPWITADRKPSKKTPLLLRYQFDCKTVPSGDLFLVLERPDLYTITINGKKLKKSDRGYWMDPCQRKLALPDDMLKQGINTIELDSMFHDLLPGLEAMFILGDFSVKNNAIDKAVKTVSCGDLCKKGFPHYSGNFTYVRTVELNAKKSKVFLAVPEWRGVGYLVSVNGYVPVFVGWAPFETEITQFLKPGKNELKIQFLGSRRNSHGPFYDTDDTPAWCGSGNLANYAHSDRYLIPFGMLGVPALRFMAETGSTATRRAVTRN